MLVSTSIGRRGFLATLVIGAAGLAIPAQAETASPLDPRLMPLAMASFCKNRALVQNADLIVIADYAQPSLEKRFHLVDMVTGGTVSMLVAHGRGSDPAHSGWLQEFSNIDGSNACCAGMFITRSEYVGKHGRSMRLEGLDPTNNNALERAIVLHTAPYVSDAMVRAIGKLGRSQGCSP